MVLDVSPTFNTVSIIPGIDCLAPERIDTSSGSVTSPNFEPIIFSMSIKASFNCESRASGKTLSLS